MKKLLFAMMLLSEVMFGQEMRAQEKIITNPPELKNEVIEMPEIGVKIVWDAVNEKLIILGTNQSENVKLSLDGKCSKPKSGTGVRVLYETTFGAAMPFYQMAKKQLSDDEFDEVSEGWEQAYIGDVVSDVDVTLSAWQDIHGEYTWILADVSVGFREIWLEVYKLDHGGETVLFSKNWFRE